MIVYTLVQSLITVFLNILCHFQVPRVAIIADIEKVYLRIFIVAHDWKYLKFLWVEEPIAEEPKIVAYCFARVAFDVMTSPLLLNVTVPYHLEVNFKSCSKLVSKVFGSLYVDNVMTGSCSDAPSLPAREGWWNRISLNRFSFISKGCVETFTQAFLGKS